MESAFDLNGPCRSCNRGRVAGIYTRRWPGTRAGSNGGASDCERLESALLPDGQPDMQGHYVPNWRTSVPPERWPDGHSAEYRALLAERYDMPAFAARGGGGPSPFSEGNLQGGSPPDTVMVVDPPDGKIPYQPWAAAKRKYMKEHLYDREEFVSTGRAAFRPGRPAI